MNLSKVFLPSLLVCLIGCGDDDGDGGPRVDDGGVDAGAFDALAADDSGGADAGIEPEPLPPALRTGVSPGVERYEDPATPDDASACYDGIDNDEGADGAEDGPDAFDCDDPDCQTLASCCVGRPSDSACCQVVGTTGNVLEALTGCAAGGSPLLCLDGVSTFGSPEPFVDSGLALGGDGTFDSGLILDTVSDLRSINLLIDADVRQADCEGGACLESAAFGVTTQDAVGPNTHIDAEVGLVISGERRQARLFVKGVIVRVWDDVETDSWTLELRPDGDVLVGRGTEAPAKVATYVPVPNARVVLWGHSRNPGATDDPGTRITSLTPRYELCDMPAAWSLRSPLDVILVDAVETTGASAPTVALDGAGVPHLVYSFRGDLYVASQTDDDRSVWFWDRSDALVDVGDPVVEPELVPTDDGFRVYYIAESEVGRSLLAADLNPAADEVTGMAQPVGLPADLTGVANPSIVRIEPPDRPERFAMALETSTGIETLASIDGIDWSRHAEVPTEALGADEVAHPSLTVVNGGYQLALSVRRGARWSIALLASAELTYWRLVEEQALTAGGGAERIGVRDMDTFVRDGRIESVYVGLDGVRATLHHAERPVPVF